MTQMADLLAKKLCDGVTLTAVQDANYKTNRITCSFFLPLCTETASRYAILPRLLTRACSMYPDFTLLNQRLSELYGARAGGMVRKIGEVQAVTVAISAIQDRYALDGKSLSAECADLLLEMLFHPALDGDAFRKEDVEQERRQLVEEIEAEFTDKRAYAKSRCEQLMCQDEAYGVNRLGSKESAAALTGVEVAAAWKEMLRTARVEIMLLGDMETDKIGARFQKAFQEFGRGKTVSCKTQTGKLPEKVREFTDRFDVAQAKLVLGFRTQTAEPDQNVMAMRLMAALYGGTAHSKLFLNVREKLSLCYYCSSRYDKNKGIMLVESGVEAANKEAAQKEILRQLEFVQAGDFTEEELQAAKLSVANSFRTVADSPAYLENWYVTQAFDGTVLSPQEAAAAVENVTKEQVVDCAKGVMLDTIYLLTGKES